LHCDCGEAQKREKAANRLFTFSICYLVLLFAALLIEKIGGII